MKGLNLAEWAIKHKPVVYFLHFLHPPGRLVVVFPSGAQ